MTFHDHRAPRPAVAPPAARELGPVSLAIATMRASLTTPPASGPVTDAIRTMRTVVPGLDADPDFRALRRALADRIEADLAALDALGGDADLEENGDLEPCAGDEPEAVNEDGGDICDEPHDAEPDGGADEDEGPYQVRDRRDPMVEIRAREARLDLAAIKRRHHPGRGRDRGNVTLLGGGIAPLRING